MRYLFIPGFDLQLFADGGAASSGDGGAGTGNAAVNAEVAAPRTGGKEDLSAVVYGKQAEPSPDAEEKTEGGEKKDDKPIDRKAAFEALIEGEYKDVYGEKVKGIVHDRLRSSKQEQAKNEAKLAELAPVLETLAKKYNIDPTDTKALAKAIEDDDEYYAEEAMNRGIPVDELKAEKKMKRENETLRRQLKAREARDNADRQYAAWEAQASKAKELYPAFDLNAELKNEAFVRLLNANIDVTTAYQVLHQDEIIPAAMQYAAKAAASQAAKSAAANAARPVENGVAKRSAAVVKDDVSKLSKADRAEINRRVARGEKITFSR